MKRLLLYFLFAIFCMNTTFAQHITFLGIQLGQTEPVTDKLIRQKGFDYTGKAYEPANMYEGSFWIYKNVSLLARTYKNKVTEIIVTPNSYLYNQPSDFQLLIKISIKSMESTVLQKIKVLFSLIYGK